MNERSVCYCIRNYYMTKSTHLCDGRQFCQFQSRQNFPAATPHTEQKLQQNMWSVIQPIWTSTIQACI